MPVTRKLTTILVMDVVGYSQLMAADEEGTLASLNTIRREIINPAVACFHGRVVKLMGDGSLLEFGSAVDAVKFGVEVQRTVNDYNQDIADDRRIAFRIGINIGDVVVEDDDIHGNGVNVASRLEGLAEPGGICVSETVVNHVRGNVDVNFSDLGMHRVKNIPEPLHVFSVESGENGIETGLLSEDPAEAEPPAKNQAASAIDIDLSLPESPSVAVLPFNNMSADPEQEYFSDGITEDIITALSKIKGLMVVARNSTFIYKGKSVDIKQVSAEQGVRYVLEGSVRKAGNRVRITAQLIDAKTGHHLWAERYDRLLEDIFAVQDEITREVTIALDVRLGGGEQAIFWSRGTTTLEAWELVRLAMDEINHNTLGASAKARELCQRALQLDPEYAMAWVVQGHSFHQMVDEATRHGYEQGQEMELTSAIECGKKALELDPSCADAYSLLSLCHLSGGEYDQALEMSRKSIELAPFHAENLAVSAIIHNKSGQPKRGLALIKTAMRYSPVYPLWFLWAMGMSYRLANRTEEAISAFETAVSRDFEYLSVHVSLASAYGELGLLEKAKKPVSEILRQNPEFSIARYMAGLSYKNPQDMERFQEGLRQAGLPE